MGFTPAGGHHGTMQAPPRARTRNSRRPRRRAIASFAALMAVLAGAVAVGGRLLHRPPALGPPCTASNGVTRFTLDLEQARNATTIAAVGKKMGLPDHAVTVALAAALQESKLYNLAHGDLDSVGLFQQRPSQGWGTTAQILQPDYAATAFYQRLAQLPDWQTMSVTDAAQAVQHSAAPDAYAQWDQPARVLAEALTGEVAAGFSCRITARPVTLQRAALARAEQRELGSPATGVAVETRRGWTVAAWLVGHAREFGITAVAFDGEQWRAAAGAWLPRSPASDVVVATLR